MSALGDLFETIQPAGGRVELHCTLPTEHFDAAAVLAARGIVERRLAASPRLRDVWLAQLVDPETEIADERDRQLLKIHLCENLGTPTDPSTDIHLGGLVAEALWTELVTDLDEGLGVPIRVEGHNWSATDPGGDGLTVYRATDGSFPFRLWETKHHTAAAPVRSTVNSACRQIKDRSLSYLARFSLIEQQLADDDLAAFYGELTERWVDRDPAVGVGISVGIGVDAVATDCFGHVETYFELPADRHHGHLYIVDNFTTFSHAVRDEVWKGCGLWTAP